MGSIEVMTSNIVTRTLTTLALARSSAPAMALATAAPDLERWLLENGRDFPPALLPPSWQRGREGNCYANARLVAAKSQGLYSYAEGWAVPDAATVPVPHGWVVDQSGRAYEVTWAVREPVYFGVAFNRTFVKRFRAEVGTELSILLWSQAGWPIQTGRIPRSVWGHPLE